MCEFCSNFAGLLFNFELKWTEYKKLLKKKTPNTKEKHTQEHPKENNKH